MENSPCHGDEEVCEKDQESIKQNYSQYVKYNEPVS